jgi:hypothetical protein
MEKRMGRLTIPTLPAAPEMTTVSPFLIFPISFKPYYAVSSQTKFSNSSIKAFMVRYTHKVRGKT